MNVPKVGINSRLDLFEKHLKNKRVLHIGCSDSPVTKERIRENKLLHQYLGGITEELYGMDISKEGIELMAKEGIKNIFVGSIYNIPINSDKFDVILVSEIIEHLTNPGLAIDSIKEYILRANPECEVIFTVPNYHNYFRNLISGLRCKEFVHSDHNFYFSYRTFKNLIECYNFRVDYFSFVTYFKYPKWSKKQIGVRLMSKLSPCIAPYLYFKCHVENTKKRLRG